jgi:endonuclease/exonuclease/phosphatase (EEP) superfamily protein YafD
MTTKAKVWRWAILGGLLLGSAVLALRLFTIVVPLPWFLHDPLIYLPALLCVVGAVPFLLLGLGVLAGRRWLLCGPLALLAVNAAFDYRPASVEPSGPPADTTYRVLTYNIFQTRLANEEILAFLREQRPDVLLLQEVPTSFYRAHKDELRRLFRHVQYYGELLTAANLDVVESEGVDLASRRTLHRLRVRDEGREFEVYNTHLSVVRPFRVYERLGEQRQQLGTIVERLRAAGRPYVIGGDFNFPPRSTGYRVLEALGSSARSESAGFGYSFNSFVPLAGIDHVFAGPGVRFLHFATVPVRLSDHFPVTARFAVEP